ncbi:hypothetical protein MUP77_01985 [Candidatus Bathyarchaeota archaeon]|nr:hypothetical protein [Candidatus Bathyarchaeota archaeon]
MVLRTKTVEFAFLQYVTSLATATRYDFGAITLYIPEVNSRTFRSVIVEVTCMDNVTTTTSMTANLIGIKLGAVAFDDQSHTVTITNSGEQNAYHLMRNVTAYFASNFGAGGSQTCQVGVMFTGPSTINHTAKLIITYEYDDNGVDTRIKTVRIPLESGLGALTTSLAEIGTNQVPVLDTFLPEASKVFRDMFFMIEGNEGSSGTTDFQHGCSLDAEAEALDGLHEQGLQSARWWRRIWKRTDMTTNVVHAFKMRTTVTASGPCNHLSIVLVVTYEYSHTNSTSIMNSVAMPFCLVPCETRGSTVGDKDTLQFTFFAEETNPVLVQSGVQLHWVNSGSSNLSISCGVQSSYRTYVETSAAYCGGISCSHRVDVGSQYGAGISITRGENAFTINAYSSAANIRHGALSGILHLNYTSGKHADGDGVHNHTVVWGTHFKNANKYLVQLATVQPQISETNYWVTHFGWQAYTNKDTTGIANNAVCNFGAERTTGEGPQSGFQLLDEGMWGYTLQEASVCVFCGDASEDFDMHPNETDTNRLGVEVSRSFALGTFSHVCGAMLYISYHAITYAVSGTVSGYTGDGSGITVEVHRADTDEKVLSGITTTGGTYSLTWYDNVVSLFAQARQDATHIGRSDDAVAT